MVKLIITTAYSCHRSCFLKCGILLALMIVFPLSNIIAQNVGIGTNNPTRKLSVSGSIMVDHSNQNSGTLDSAALVFGTGGTGIISKK